METYNDMLARHDKEMQNLMNTQNVSWSALNQQYGQGNIPIDVHQQWDQRYGNQRLHGLRTQHFAEAEAYPANLLECRYKNDPQPLQEPDQKPSVFEQLERQQQQRSQGLNEQLFPEVKMKEQPQKACSRFWKNRRNSNNSANAKGLILSDK